VQRLARGLRLSSQRTHSAIRSRRWRSCYRRFPWLLLGWVELIPIVILMLHREVVRIVLLVLLVLKLRVERRIGGHFRSLSRQGLLGNTWLRGGLRLSRWLRGKGAHVRLRLERGSLRLIRLLRGLGLSGGRRLRRWLLL
jgi:hypothetical protein